VAAVRSAEGAWNAIVALVTFAASVNDVKVVVCGSIAAVAETWESPQIPGLENSYFLASQVSLLFLSLARLRTLVTRTAPCAQRGRRHITGWGGGEQEGITKPSKLGKGQR
jgi:hypothetical protein